MSSPDTSPMVLDPVVERAWERVDEARHVVLSGPAGCGKTALLSTLGDRFAVVDDADRAPGEVLAGLTRRVASGAAVAVAHRPFHRNPELSVLLGALAPPVLRVRCGPLRRAQVARMLARTGSTPAAARLDAVYEQTAGVPAFVELAVSADPVGAFGPVLDAVGVDTRRLVLALALGAPLDDDLLGEALGVGGDALVFAVEEARSVSAIRADGAVVPIVAHACRALADPRERAAVLRALVREQQRRGLPVRGLAESVLDAPVVTARQADLMLDAGREALRDRPDLAQRFLAAAARSGAPPERWAPGAAQARVLTGDLDGALRVADEVAGTSAGAVVTAVVLARRGELARAAQLLASARGADARHIAAIGHAATGSWRTAAELLEEQFTATALPDTVGRAMARGVLDSVTGAPTDALSALISAAHTAHALDRPLLLPDTPTALAAQLALHLGEFEPAEALLSRVRARPEDTSTARHRLLDAHRHLLTGDHAAAADALPDARGLEPREALLAAAARVGLARRAGDLRAVDDEWGRAYQALLAQPVDLLTLLPLGELAVAAARLGRWHHVEAHLDQAWDLLDRCGHPASWSVLPHWHAMQAALVAGRRPAVRDHHEHLVRHRDRTTLGKALAPAADCWATLVDGHVDVAVVDQAAKALHAAGLRWDATRLAWQAAIRTTDRAAITRLLDIARQLADHTAGTTAGVLSERERQVAELVLEGLTYRQIGNRLFISAKTVEHHVTKIRHKLGSRNRRELVGDLDDLLSR
ncbi:helix-turn-helix transcriptional regulator [Saccharothrix lopnurensis]|uniref:LuxR C-terminal-related transcriptional regulator n=1 Tax=Saccharothrix lopnurensis TaxID=1670621 RepID=A0ABW1PBU9_9PSEU